MNAENIEKYRQAERTLWAHYGVEPTERFLDLAKPKVRVRVLEVGAGEPVLFIHGAPNAGSTWAPLATQMQDFRCILLDRPGTGLSEVADLHGPPSRAGLVDMVVSVIEALELPKVDLIVSSFGGYLGLELARARPERVGRMVQQACPGMVPEMRMPMFMRIMTIPTFARLMGKQQPSVAGSKNIFRQIGHATSLDANRFPQAILEWYTALQMYTDTMANEVGLIQTGMTWRGVRKGIAISWDDLRHATTPTAFFWGSNDAFGDIALARRIVQAMPNATLEELTGGGHLPWLDDPERAARHARDFLRQATISGKGESS